MRSNIRPVVKSMVPVKLEMRENSVLRRRSADGIIIAGMEPECFSRRDVKKCLTVADPFPVSEMEDRRR